jgi:hypothetical protein
LLLGLGLWNGITGHGDLPAGRMEVLNTEF